MLRLDPHDSEIGAPNCSRGFLAVFALYLAMGPATAEGRGYVPEEIETAKRVVTILDAWYKGRVVPEIVWNHHGLIPVLFDIPFVKFGNARAFRNWRTKESVRD